MPLMPEPEKDAFTQGAESRTYVRAFKAPARTYEPMLPTPGTLLTGHTGALGARYAHAQVQPHKESGQVTVLLHYVALTGKS